MILKQQAKSSKGLSRIFLACVAVADKYKNTFFGLLFAFLATKT
jgi:hypothetical protein